MEPSSSSSAPRGCTPVSVNCVMWDGSDLCCITVCRNDTARDIMFKIAKKVCLQETQLDMSTLDLKCLAGCATGLCDYDLQDVLQLIIDQLAECCCDRATATSSGNYVPPTYVVPASMRYVDNNGDTIDTLGGESYLQLTGQTVGVLVDRADATDTQLSSQNSRITELETNPPPEYTPPTVEAPVVMGDSDSYQMPVVIEATDEYIGELRTTLGTNAQLLTGVGGQGTVGTQAAFSINGIVSALPNWIASPNKVSDFITNTWVYMKDLRFGVDKALTQSAVTCNDIIFDYELGFSSNAKTLYIYVRGYSTLPAGFTDDSPSGTIKLVDGAGSIYTDTFSFVSAMTGASVSIDLTTTGLAIGADITSTISVNVTDGTLDCQKQTVKTIQNDYVVCPSVSTGVTTTTATYVFNPPVNNNVTYTVDLLNAATLAVLDTNTHVDPTEVVSDSFTGLTTATNYKIRVTVSITTMPSVVCGAYDITTA